ncbi:MAG TPA: bifunctional diaminohydroxyphosphoribosylaminopyrimidine deaminase/5-amino-6-(5-phosphoribosylamino)uracil reductase RibD [Solirubrobacteraceae bacterium]|nr:bifunctional diaminohydroxyphosphoribosylaminopyrimidine deaminase/5-amino-6-(5-phosphoribosylamino)uracil reductase RibD [Solirubrobacteraceae bacterium]
MSSTRDADQRHLARAVELAERGWPHVSPNPLVGAVIAHGEETLGEGYHRAVGEPHAEVEAIRAAGARDLSLATLYVSLEPCCHQGRTPPCTEAIREAGIRRVVVASDDPSEHAAGRGLGILRDEGVDVVVADGELAARARRLNQPFRKHARTGRPWILFKSAMSLDGKVATHTGDSQWISGEESRHLVHEWRSTLDAVVVGIGTAMADDPLLTARLPGASGVRQPRRVVFDSLARLPLTSRLVADASEVPLTVVVSRAAPRTATDGLKTHGVDVIVATGENEQARVGSALEQLGADGVTSILLEGGPRLAGSFLDAGEIDEIRLFVAPIVLGGRNARDPLESEGVDSIADAVRSLTLTCDRVGDDLLITSRVREW